MKKTTFLFLIMMLTVTTGMSAQNSSSLVNDDSLNKWWCFYGYGTDGNTLFTERYSFGDSYERNGKTYIQLLIERNFLDNNDIDQSGNEGRPPFYSESTGVIGIREFDGRIFVNREDYLGLLAKTSYWSWEGDVDYLPYEQTSDGEIVLYDFTKQTGDKFLSLKDHSDISVESVKTIVTLDGVTRRVQILSNGNIVVEGVGCINSSGIWLCYLNPAQSPCKRSKMENMYMTEGGNPFFSWEEINTLSVKNIRPSIAKCNSVIYDLQGRLSHSPSRGMYIQDGRKVVVK
jgi:hypothetical protein